MEPMTHEPSKTPSASAVVSRHLLMPQHANPRGTAFGGTIMAWMDTVAGMAAERHCGRDVVTVGIDSLAFKQPIRIGDQVVLKASVNYVSRTSMEVGVQVTRENPHTGEKCVATTAHLTFVALDEEGCPVPAPSLTPETADEKRRYAHALQRVRQRKERLKAETQAHND
jgi:acyl-CoA hydrolase